MSCQTQGALGKNLVDGMVGEISEADRFPVMGKLHELVVDSQQMADRDFVDSLGDPREFQVVGQD